MAEILSDSVKIICMDYMTKATDGAPAISK